jgi:hypothetical protein
MRTQFAIAVFLFLVAAFFSESVWIGVAFFWIFVGSAENADLRIKTHGLACRVSDLERNVASLEASIYGDGK